MYNYNQYPKTTQQTTQQYPQPVPQGYGWQQQQVSPIIQPTYGWQNPQQPAAATLKGRPVSSFDEARVSIIDFDGSVFYFPDLANGKIYTKQINIDGTATTNVYTLTETPTEVQNRANNSGEYVSKVEFEQAMNQLQNAILSLAPKADQRKEEVKNFI